MQNVVQLSPPVSNVHMQYLSQTGMHRNLWRSHISVIWHTISSPGKSSLLMTIQRVFYCHLFSHKNFYVSKDVHNIKQISGSFVGLGENPYFFPIWYSCPAWFQLLVLDEIIQVKWLQSCKQYTPCHKSNRLGILPPSLHTTPLGGQDGTMSLTD